MKNKKLIISIFILLFIGIIAVDVIYLQDDYYEGKFFKMDTNISIYGKGTNMDLATRDILKEIDRIDDEMNARKVGSTLYMLNNSENKTIKADKETIKLLDLAKEINTNSNGAFNVAIKPVVDLWGFGGNYKKVPNDEEIKKAVNIVQNTEIFLNETEIVLSNGEIDLGGIAKGYASDKSREILKKHKVEYAVLDFGGNIVTYGVKPDGKKFNIGIDDGKDGIFASVLVGETCVVTSGGYERYFEENGKKYHHLLNPETGYPAENGLISVTVISENGALADALSTACFVLGEEKGSVLAEKYNVAAVFLNDDKSVKVVGELEITIDEENYTLKK